MTTLVEIPFRSTTITAMSDEGKPLVSLRHMCESIGLDVESQRKKLAGKSWARAVLSTATGSDGKSYKMHMIDRRTMTMWLATIEPSRVKPEARPMLEAFQNEAADALDAYFHEGGAINLNATDEQLANIDAQISQLRGQAEIVNLLRGVVASDHLDNAGRIILARAMGEKPFIEPENRALTVAAFLKEKNLTQKEARSIRSMFGRYLAGAYQARHGKAPESAPEIVNGRDIDVNHYIERDRHLFDEVWNRHYAEKFESLMNELETI